MHIAKSENQYDVIMVDSTEPVGPAVNLFTKGFYAGIAKALKEDGIFVAQTDNPWFTPELITNVQRDVKEIFPITKLYTANIPTYPSGLWTFTIGSKNMIRLQWKTAVSLILTRNITQKIFIKRRLFLPKFVSDLIK